ncbi:MAG: hypothetical protein AB8I08_33795 [Sandaracinaceae bacterium]
MPYRSREPIRHYALRSSRTMIVVTVLVVGLALAAMSLSSGLLMFGGSLLPMLIVGVLLLVAVAYVHSLKNEIVSGGKGEVVLYERSFSVPRSIGTTTLEFSYADLGLSVTRIESRTLGATVAVVSRLTLEGGGVTRALSSRLFESDDAFEALVRDLEALRQGQPLPPQRAARAPVEEKDEMDDRLDAELAELD